MIDRLDSELSFSRNALNLRTYRQELIASNIANADTPYYKARDIDFKSALAGLTSAQTAGSLGLARTAATHMQGSGGNAYGADVKYRSEYQSAVDGNTVDVDIERSAFAENAVHVEALLSFVRTKLSDLKSALASS